MSESISLSIPEAGIKSYLIHFGIDIVQDIDTLISPEKYSKLVAVFDKGLYTKWKDKLKWNGIDSIVIDNTGEDQKTAPTLEKLWDSFADHGIDRHSLILNVGGGATCDLGAFAAATYMRGVSFINIPTTLLSQVDSSIGGKNGINHHHIKNLVGTFAQPEAVIIDVAWLRTLSKNEIASGYAEIIKHGLICDKDFYKQLLLQGIDQISEAELLKIIERSCEIKGDVVTKDPYEKNLRKILNFGHTIGHALESFSHQVNTPLLHGEAISLGMVAESVIAKELGMLDSDTVKEIEGCFARYELPIRMTLNPSFEELLTIIKHDKKNKGGVINCALIGPIGKCEIDRPVSEDLLRLAIDYLRVKR